MQVESDLPLEFAKKCLEDPTLLLTSNSEHIQQIKKYACSHTVPYVAAQRFCCCTPCAIKMAYPTCASCPVGRDAHLSELTLLGGFKNNRSVFDW